MVGFLLSGLKIVCKSHGSNEYMPKPLSASACHRAPSLCGWQFKTPESSSASSAQEMDLAKPSQPSPFLTHLRTAKQGRAGGGWLHHQAEGSVPRSVSHQGTTSFSLKLQQAKILKYWRRGTK